jgi:hypothetical protein
MVRQDNSVIFKSRYTLLLSVASGGKNNPVLRFILINRVYEVNIFLAAKFVLVPLSLRISLGITAFAGFILVGIRFTIAWLTAGRCLHAPLDSPPELAKPRRILGSLYTLRYV